MAAQAAWIAKRCWHWLAEHRNEFAWFRLDEEHRGARFRPYVELMMLTADALANGVRGEDLFAVAEFLVELNEEIDWDAHLVLNQQFLVPAATAARLRELTGHDAGQLRRIVVRRVANGVHDDSDRIAYRRFETLTRLHLISAVAVGTEECVAHLRASLRRLAKPVSYFDDQDVYALTHALMFVVACLGRREARGLFEGLDVRLRWIVHVAAQMAYADGKYDLLGELVACLTLFPPAPPLTALALHEIAGVLRTSGALPLVRDRSATSFEERYHATLVWGYAGGILTAGEPA